MLSPSLGGLGSLGQALEGTVNTIQHTFWIAENIFVKVWDLDGSRY